MFYFFGYFVLNFLFIQRASTALRELSGIPLLLLMSFGSLVTTSFFHYLDHYRRKFNGGYSILPLKFLVGLAAPLAPFGYLTTMLWHDKISFLLLVASLIYFVTFSQKMTQYFVKILPIDVKDADLKLFFRHFPPQHKDDLKNLRLMLFLMLLMPLMLRLMH